MARDKDDFASRRRQRENEVKENVQEGPGSGVAGFGQSDKLLKLLHEVEIQMERVHTLYLQFFSGAEKLPPKEARSRLDQLLRQLNESVKIGPANLFRVQTTLQRVRTYQESWEKRMKELEAGKRVRG